MSNECIKVMIRCRPLSTSELNRNNYSIIEVIHERNEIKIIQPNQTENVKVFTYDAVFDEKDSQQQVYEHTAFSLVDQVIEGYNGTIFAYGQTGCGKTHSMVGDPSSDEQKGLIPRTFGHIMGVIDQEVDKQFLIRCSFIEIYNEDIHDLLAKENKAKKEMKESPDKGVFIKDLNMMVCKSVEELDRWMNMGNNSRSVGATLMNNTSSRSHSLFTVYIECQKNIAGQDSITAGKLNLVDLAGSERQSKTQATGDRLKEATKINLSLSALGNVISALVDGKSQHIPYRDSKLTRLLQDSLGGNTKTIMIAAISPADYNYDETLGTLRYAARAKNIINKPKVNEDPKDALLKQYMEEINRLKKLLENQDQSFQPSNNMPFEINTNKQENIGFFPAMKDANHVIDFEQEKQRIKDQLRLKDEKFEQERQERQKLELMMEELKQNMVKGGQGKSDKRDSKLQDIRNKLNSENQIKEQLLLQKKLQEEALEDIKQSYNSVQEEVNELRIVLQRLQKKRKAQENEIRDIQHENQLQKQELLETIRIQQKEQQFYDQVLNKLLHESEIDKVKGCAVWQDSSNSFQIPLFIIKDRKVKFPSLVGYRLVDYVNKEKESRELEFINLKTKQQEPQNAKSEKKTSQQQNQNQFYNAKDQKQDASNKKKVKKKKNQMEINLKATFQFKKMGSDLEFNEDDEQYHDSDFE